jgi:chromosomal replication initiator protein
MSDPTTKGDLQRSVLGQLLTKVRREQFETWFRSVRIGRVDDKEMEFSVTSQFVRDWIQKNHLPTLRDVAAADGNKRTVTVSLRTEDGWDSLGVLGVESTVRPADAAMAVRGLVGTGPTQPPAFETSMRSESQSSHSSSTLGFDRRRPLHLNPNYTFEKFVVGPCNRLAHATALAVSENPGGAYNPLFIHGNVGLGKSHLLQAICHTITKRNPQARVLYLSCEEFTNSFIQAIQTNSLDEFRNLHRHVDVLVIDDIQFLANKDKTQEEFFHTFNSLKDLQKQIVLSSDRSPVEIPTIEERLVSRFKWGLVAEIEAPCFETRVAIVRRKAKGRGIDLADDVSCYIAERVTANIRELEGAVIKVVGIAAITGRPITLQLAEEALRGVAVTRHTQVSTEDVFETITEHFSITARDLTGKSRTQAVSQPRQIAMYLLREHTELSLEDIGRVFGNRDHTTVLYAVTKIRDRKQSDRLFRDILDSLSVKLMNRPAP